MKYISTLKSAGFWDVMLLRLVRIDVSEDCVASIFRVESLRETTR
jgi:hypothetical protein